MSTATCKIVIHKGYGGFEIPPDIHKKYQTFAGKSYDEHQRDDPLMITLLETCPAHQLEAYRLQIVEIPADVDWVIQENEGNEWIAERHRTWR